jgi:hypothetical protein
MNPLKVKTASVIFKPSGSELFLCARETVHFHNAVARDDFALSDGGGTCDFAAVPLDDPNKRLSGL